MTTPAHSPQDVRQFILDQVSAHPKDISRLAAERFNITRQAAARHVSNLVREGLLTATGATKAREYRLATLASERFTIDVTPQLEEHLAWRKYVAPFLGNTNDNVRRICEYGVTEMVNNVIDHAESQDLIINVQRDAVKIKIDVIDHGVGIFNKIQRDFHLDDPREALLELSKGKLTSNEARHSGEGIFFTSRMFDAFIISSGGLFFVHQEDDWLLEGERVVPSVGTGVSMWIALSSTRTPEEVFDAHRAEHDEFGFSKTHVPIRLARYDTDQLVSRSQARRVLARFEKFREVLLDFKDVLTIGQAFADEIFRVYRRDHPNTLLFPINTTPAIDRMIQHVTIAALEERAGTAKSQ